MSWPASSASCSLLTFARNAACIISMYSFASVVISLVFANMMSISLLFSIASTFFFVTLVSSSVAAIWRDWRTNCSRSCFAFFFPFGRGASMDTADEVDNGDEEQQGLAIGFSPSLSFSSSNAVLNDMLGDMEGVSV